MVSDPVQVETSRSTSVKKYFAFAKWLASKRNFSPAVKARLLCEVVEFFGLDRCSTIYCVPSPFSYVVVSNGTTKCFVVDSRGNVTYAHYQGGAVGESIEVWE